MAALEFHRAAPQDAQAIGALHSACWRAAYRGVVPDGYLDAFTPQKRAAFFARILPTTPNENYILRAGGTDIGMLAFGPAGDDDLPAAVGEIQALYLLPAHWGKGYGRAAMDYAAERLRALGYAEMALWALDGNLRAIRFYTRYGFAPDGKREPITLGEPLTESRYRMPLGG